MRRLILFGTLSVMLGSVLAVTPALAQPMSAEQVRINKARFAEYWKVATPAAEVTTVTQQYIHLYTSTTQEGKFIWGLMGPSGFASYIEIRILDSKGKEVGEPVVLAIYPRDHVPGQPFQAPFNWGHDPSRQIKLRVVFPHKKKRSKTDVILKVKDALIVERT